MKFYPDDIRIDFRGFLFEGVREGGGGHIFCSGLDAMAVHIGEGIVKGVMSYLAVVGCDQS